MLYRFKPEEVEILIVLALRHAAECVAKTAEQRPAFAQACRIVSELHDPTPSMRAALAPGIERTANHLGLDMVEAAQREGIDVEKELGRFDPRAAYPRCIHGRKMPSGADPGEPCVDCSPPSGILKFELGEEERFALDAALEQRRRELAGEHAVVIKHTDECATNDNGHQKCNCDFGRRLATELGIPYGGPGRYADNQRE